MKTVEFILEQDAFAFYDEKSKSWIVEPGAFEIRLGSSSQDIRAADTLELKMP